MYTAIGIADPDLHAFPDIVFFFFIQLPHFSIIYKFPSFQYYLSIFVNEYEAIVHIRVRNWRTGSRIIPIFLRIRISRRKDPNSPLAAQIHAAVLVERNISILYILT